MTTQPVLIPARRFQVEVILGSHDGLTLVEQYILRTIALGVATIEAVAQALGLPDRMVLDATVDLLSREVLDVQNNGTLAVNERLREAMGNPGSPQKDWFLGFQSALLPEPRTVSLVQDLVAGEVFSLPRVPIDRERLPAMPTSDAVPELEEIPLAILVASVTNAMRAPRQLADARRADDLHDDPLPRDARILGVRLARTPTANQTSATVGVRGMSILAHVLVKDRGADQPPRVAIVEPVAMPLHVRRSISTALDDLWMRGFARGAGQFFARVESMTTGFAEEREEEQGLRRRSPAILVEQMKSLLETTGDNPDQTHDQLAELESTAGDQGERLAGFAGSAELVPGTAATFQEIALEALQSAREQVVLACPWVNQIQRGPWQDAIRDALARGVKVVLVWGIDGKALPEGDRAWQAINALAREHAQRGLVFANRGAGSHAKLIVADASWAVVTSSNFLNAAPERTRREIGIRVRTTDETVPLALQSMLAWARRRIPDHAARQRCIDSPALFGARETRPDLRLSRSPVSPPNFAFGKEIGLDVWRRDWLRRVTELEALVGLRGACVLPVFDGEHRDVFVRSIEQAQARLLIGSHRVSGYGLTEPIVQGLLTARGRGVEVVIAHGTDEALEPAIAERLVQLRDAGVTIVATDTHAKVLIHDDWAIASSFNFLSADPGIRGAHELGLQTNDPTVLAGLWSSF